ncbi:MFS transporter [Paenibacillus sp. Z6-24]
MIRKSFYMLWGTQTVSNIADIVYTLSLVTLVFTESGSLLTTIFIPLFRMLSKMISGLIAPLVMSRSRLTSILIGSQLGQFLIFTGLIFYLWTSVEPLYPIIFMAVFGMSFLDGWTDPARNALIPRLATGDGLMRANGLMSVSDQIVKCSGWALSGVIVAVIGAIPTMWIASVSYFLAMFFTAFIRDPYAAAGLREAHSADSAASGAEGEPRKPTYGQQLSEGWKILATNRRIRTLAIVDNIDTLGGAAWLGAFILAFVVQVLHKDVSWWGFMNTVFFIGSIAGGVFIIARVKKIQKNAYLLMLLSLLVYVVVTFFFAFNTIPMLALILLAISGLPVQIAGVIRQTLIQQNLTPEETPSAMSALSVLSNFTFAIAMLLLGWIADRFGMRDMYVVAGLMTTAAVVLGFAYRAVFREQVAGGYAAEENVVVNKA